MCVCLGGVALDGVLRGSDAVRCTWRGNLSDLPGLLGVHASMCDAGECSRPPPGSTLESSLDVRCGHVRRRKRCGGGICEPLGCVVDVVRLSREVGRCSAASATACVSLVVRASSEHVVRRMRCRRMELHPDGCSVPSTRPPHTPRTRTGAHSWSCQTRTPCTHVLARRAESARHAVRAVRHRGRPDACDRTVIAGNARSARAELASLQRPVTHTDAPAALDVLADAPTLAIEPSPQLTHALLEPSSPR
jgi:hypothetical protein